MPQIRYEVEGLGTALKALQMIGTDVHTMREELAPAARTLALSLKAETPKRTGTLSRTVSRKGNVKRLGISAGVGNRRHVYGPWLAFGKQSPRRHFLSKALYGRLSLIEEQISLAIQRILNKHS